MHAFKICSAVLLSCFLIAFNLSAQEHSLKTFEQEYKDAIEAYKEDLEKEAYESPWDKSLIVEYKTDLYKAEKYEIYVAGSTGTTESILDGQRAAYDFYDKLLNKYYQKLLKRLQTEDQETLKQSQRNWMAFRDSESKLSYLITDFKYSGGGSLERITDSARDVEVVKTRLEDIFNYLQRCMSIEEVKSFD
jgi:uncharacterized protein YecT (DUF1311 family)